MTRGSGVAAIIAEPVEAFAGGPLPVRIRAWDGSEVGPLDAPAVVLKSRRAVRHLLWHPGELGLARAYVSGDLDIDGDLEDGFRRVAQFGRERSAARSAAHSATTPRPRWLLGIGRWFRALGAFVRVGGLGPRPRPPASEARLHGRLHTRTRDRDVIAHHYDLSNEFYELVLDEHMAYSCAYWTSDDPDYPLAAAQRDKLDLVCRKLELQPGSHLLDVGCGWGSLTVYAARHYGARVTGVTLSRQQHDFVTKRVADLGLTDLVDVRLADYRDLAGGPFDAAASIEMGEHVGDEHYPAFVARFHELLRPGGRLLIQQMSRGPGLPGGGPFIEAYIAADMHMRPVGETVTLLESGGFEIRHVEAMREHYARTGRAWRATLEERWDDVVAVVGEETARVWRLYLVGGSLTFEEGRMGVDQILSVKPSGVGLGSP